MLDKGSLVELTSRGRIRFDTGHYETHCKARFAQVVHRNDEDPLNSFMMELYLHPDGSKIFVTYTSQEVLKNDVKNKEFDYILRRHERTLSPGDPLPSDLEDFVELLNSKGFL